MTASIRTQLAFTTITKICWINILFKEFVLNMSVISLIGSVSYNNKTKSEPHHAVITDQYRNTDMMQLKQLLANLHNMSI